MDRFLHDLFGEPLGHWVKLGTVTPHAQDVFHRACTNNMTILTEEFS